MLSFYAQRPPSLWTSRVEEQREGRCVRVAGVVAKGGPNEFDDGQGARKRREIEGGSWEGQQHSLIILRQTNRSRLALASVTRQFDPKTNEMSMVVTESVSHKLFLHRPVNFPPLLPTSSSALLSRVLNATRMHHDTVRGRDGLVLIEWKCFLTSSHATTTEMRYF